MLEIPIQAGRGIDPGDSDEPVPVLVDSISVAELPGGADEALGREVGGSANWTCTPPSDGIPARIVSLVLSTQAIRRG